MFEWIWDDNLLYYRLKWGDYHFIFENKYDINLNINIIIIIINFYYYSKNLFISLLLFY